MNYEGNFSEQDIRVIYEDWCGDRADIKVIARYKTQKGYMALVFLYDEYCLFFVYDGYFQFRIVRINKGHNEESALRVANDIAGSIGAEKIVE